MSGHDGLEPMGPGGELLSPPERRVLANIREGLLDAEIAVRMGVATGEVKRHIESMLAKLRLSDRAALRDWDGSPPAVVPGAGAGVDGAPGDVFEDAPRPRVSRASVAGLVVAVAAVVGVLVVLATRGGGTDEPAPAAGEAVTPTPAATPTPDPLAIPSAVGGVPVEELVELPVGEFPAALVVYLTPGCLPCTAGGALSRLTRQPTGMQEEVLFRPESGSLWAVRVDPGGWDIAAVVCHAGPCTDSASGGPRSFVLHVSRDGGITWGEVLQMETEGLFPVRFDGNAVEAWVQDAGQEGRRVRVHLDGGANAIETMAATTPGEVFNQGFSPPAAIADVLYAVAPAGANEPEVYSWGPRERGDQYDHYFVGAARDGELISAFVGFGTPWSPLVGTASGIAVAIETAITADGNAISRWGLLAAVQGSVLPLPELDAAFADRGLYPMGAAMGPWARIVAPGGCAPYVTVSKDLATGCIADGVLGRQLRGFRTGQDGASEALVILPGVGPAWVEEGQLRFTGE
ncbi:MAG: helix-turn-helix transcriptional regulator [Dehalococcoidia bacterium]|nr:helix-turn-helix transcriptional regulator [Dehalococcoidia bacterium]